jgi:hypothetical protein
MGYPVVGIADLERLAWVTAEAQAMPDLPPEDEMVQRVATLLLRMLPKDPERFRHRQELGDALGVSDYKWPRHTPADLAAELVHKRRRDGIAC